MKQLTARLVLILLTAALGIASAALWLVSHSHQPAGPRPRVPSRRGETQLTMPGAPTGETPKLFPVFKDGKTGFIDKTGKLIIPLKFPTLYVQGDFSDGLARVMVGGKFGYIDKAGSMVIGPQYPGAGEFSEGLAPVEISGRWGYIDKAGKVVIKPRFDSAGEFVEGIAPVMTGAVHADVPQTGARNGYIDRTGRYVWRPSG